VLTTLFTGLLEAAVPLECGELLTNSVIYLRR
jgi:hypothetical protein